MKLFAAAATAALLLSGCAGLGLGPAKLEYSVTARFDPEKARQAMAPGSNTVKGSAFLRQRGGGVVTCAGSAVNLIPATTYAQERMLLIYRTQQGPAVAPPRPRTFQPDYSDYYTLQGETRCDAQGSFTFERVADGDFYVVTSVVWTVGYNTQGGALMNRLKVAGGQVTNVVLAD